MPPRKKPFATEYNGTKICAQCLLTERTILITIDPKIPPLPNHLILPPVL